jgi:hypothetical protein
VFEATNTPSFQNILLDSLVLNFKRDAELHQKALEYFCKKGTISFKVQYNIILTYLAKVLSNADEMENAQYFDMEIVAEFLEKYEGKHILSSEKQFECIEQILDYLPAEFAQSFLQCLSATYLNRKTSFSNKLRSLTTLVKHFGDTPETVECLTHFIEEKELPDLYSGTKVSSLVLAQFN